MSSEFFGGTKLIFVHPFARQYDFGSTPSSTAMTTSTSATSASRGYSSLTVCGASADGEGNVRVYLVGLILCIIDWHMYQGVYLVG
jgi:hypothetical protein